MSGPFENLAPAVIAGVAAVAFVNPAGDKLVDGEAVSPAQVGHRQPHVRRLERAGVPVRDRHVDPADGDDGAALARSAGLGARAPEHHEGAGDHRARGEAPGIADDHDQAAARPRGRFAASRSADHDLAAGHPAGGARVGAAQPVACVSRDPKHAAAHRHAGVVPHVAAHVHQAAGHAGADAVARVAVDDQFASGHAGAEAVHVRHRTQDAHAGGTLAADLEEIAERALSRAGPRRQRGDLAYAERREAVRGDAVRFDHAIDRRAQFERHDRAHAAPSPAMIGRR